MDELKEQYMREAIKEAEKAAAIGEVPIGAVIVWKGEIIGRGHNEREVTNDATTHAEMTAIREANAFKQELAARGSGALCDLGALPDVLRRDPVVADQESLLWCIRPERRDGWYADEPAPG
jgi:pyrimidine deaminase RibD-like protein